MMNYRVTIFILFNLAATTAFCANLSINFVQPEKFTDAAYASEFTDERQRMEVQQDIQAHFQKLATQNLPADYVLKIDVLDIDLAGRFEPFAFSSPSDLRIVRDITWPRINLRYTLLNGGKVVKSGEEKIVDIHFMLTSNRYWNSDRLRYEKSMLDNWFRKNLAKDGNIVENKKIINPQNLHLDN